MKTRLALAAIALLGAGLAACGSGARAPNGGYKQPVAHRDRDDDGDRNNDDGKYLEYGHAAGTQDARAIASLVRRYYAAAASEQGAKACALLDPVLEESVVEQYGHVWGLQHSNCAAVTAKLYGEHHQALVGESATVQMYAIRVDGNKALAVLSFATVPEVRVIGERRYGKTWTIRELLDGLVE